MTSYNFKCDVCGYEYSDSHNYTACPNCFGLGKKDPQCICPHVRIGFGGVTPVKTGTDEKCPIHGQKQ